jgi:class 3 adenylate cyclase/putative methionine-R-sulfoxide reductase with GAF domain
MQPQAVIAIENARLLNELRQRTDDLTESLEQQTATSEVLQVISSSPGELEPVFEAMLQNAVRICGAKFGLLSLREGNANAFRIGATHGAPRAYVDFVRSRVFHPEPKTGLGTLVRTKEAFQFADLAAAPTHGDILRQATVDLAGARTLIGVPMLKDNEVIGAITIYRQEVRPFTDKQIELVKNFAAQVVIAIENTRLLNELRESLQQQTATADVLKVISRSTFNLQGVLDTLVESAAHLCDADIVNIWRPSGSAYRLAAVYQAVPSKHREYIENVSIAPGRGSCVGRTLLSRGVVQIEDIKDDPEYSMEVSRLESYRTMLGVPLLREGIPIGVFALVRSVRRPFTEKQIELVKTFADQAVIAIENARLFDEVQARTRELSESLEQQTATSEVLKVISSSTGELQPVFQAMLENAVRICGAKFGNLWLREGDAYRIGATHGAPAAYVDFLRTEPVFLPNPNVGLGQLAKTKEAYHLADAAAVARHSRLREATINLAGARTLVVVPMLKDDEVVGAVSIYRQEVRPFTDKQIELVKNFAAQAVIAIENSRLLNDLNKLNQQLEQRVTDQVSEIERMGRLRRFLPAQVADLIVASGAEKQLESHRREITALFCDLRGFTGFSESSDPEDVMALLREYHAAIGGIINRYGGTLERYAGDGVMVVFNDPIPVDNPALQAVLMAIDMRAAIGELIEKWRKLGHDIGFGIGIAHGYATLGTIGFEGRFDYAAIGTVSNVASRLCDEAKPGQILISPRVLMAVEKDITVEPVGDFALKGIRRPMTAYNVLDTKAAD